MYDHGARNRNPISTLWYGIDPQWEKYPDFSPYNYCAGNPVRLVDPDGETALVAGALAPSLTGPQIVVTGTALLVGYLIYKGVDYYQESRKQSQSNTSNKNITNDNSNTSASNSGNKNKRNNNDGVPAKTTDNRKKLESERNKAVKEAWKQEQILVKKTGRGTRPWTEEEINELLETGKVKGYEGHHINSVKDNPAQAGNPNNVKFVKGRKDHLKHHNGNFRNPTRGKLINRQTE